MAQAEDRQRHAAGEIISYRVEQDELKGTCSRLRGELVQAQAELAVASASEARLASSEASAQKASAAARLGKHEDTVRWHDANAVFDAFASSSDLDEGGSAPRMLPVDFGHLCERMRRSQGRGPTPETQRKDFADFAFSAVFGSEAAAVGRAEFVRLFPHFALMLPDLEVAFAARVGADIKKKVQGLQSGEVPWQDPGAVFRAFATGLNRNIPRLLRGDFTTLCQQLRRAQGRSDDAFDQDAFGDFGFTVTFGQQAASVDKETFSRLFPHFSVALKELEDAFAQGSGSS